MPVIAVGAAIAASVVAGSAVAATVGGIAAISAITAFEVVAAVGATIAAVGAVTRNKTLTMVGGAIGLVGGIGGLAASAGVLGAEAASSAPLFGASPAASAAADTGATFADSLMPATTGTGGGVEGGVWDVSGGLSAADNASAGTIDMVANGMDGRPPPGQEGFQTFSTVSEKVADPSTTLTNTVSATPPTGLPATTDVAASQSPITQAASDASSPATYGLTSTFDTGNAAGAGAGTSGGNSNMFERIFDYAGKHEKLASGVLTVGGKLLEGAFSAVTPAQVEALQAQAAANNAAAAMANQQRQNLAMPKAVASSQPVTGTPGSIIPQRPLGMINNQPQLAQVTGAPV